jgi:branched-chain amino acid transport system substrate-binding protein
MKKLWMATAASALMAAGAVSADEVRFGTLLGYTGPIESLTPHMADSAELAWQEINESGLFLDGQTIVSVRADSGCIDNALATASAERLVTSDGVVAIMGADCSGVTMAVLQNVAIPNGIPMISPSATSPAFTTVDDNGLFFRTAPSDARQGAVMSDVLMERGLTTVAVTYTNNDYGLGLADAFAANFEAAGGTITINAPHEDGKGDYSAEVGALAAAGGDILVVFGYADQGGAGIIQTSLESGAFNTFAMGDGMYGDALLANIGAGLEGTIGTIPWAEGEGPAAFEALAAAAGVRGESSFTRESYDAAALLALAAQAAGEATPEGIAANILNVANAPGEEILPGQLARGLEILANGGEVNYVGATNVELIGPGEAAGTYREYIVQDGAYQTVQFR